MKNKNSGLAAQLLNALRGITESFRRERNIRIQSTAAGLLFLFCLTTRPPALWCAAFALTAALVLSLEMVNSAVEAILDRLHPQTHPEIGFAKDCLAGSVLVASLASLLLFFIFLSTYYF